jgi:hypothetical protein
MRTFPIVLLAVSMTLPSFAATPAMEACGAKWADLKAAGKTEGQTWPQFWSQCSKDFAANNPGAATAPEKPTATKATAKSTATARNEDDSAGSSPTEEGLRCQVGREQG